MRYLIVLCLLIIASPTLAQTPLVSIERVSISAGIDYSKSSEAIGHNYGKEWELKPSINAAYNLGKLVSVTGKYDRGLKSKTNELRVGLKLRLFRGGE